MKRYFVRILVVLVMTFGLATGCGQQSHPSLSPTPEQTQAEFESPSTDDWQALNRLLIEVYELPPVRNVEQLESAAWLASGFWFDMTNITIENLEKQDIPWERTSPFFYLFDYYILHDIQFRNSSSPMEFMATEHLLVESVKTLADAANELVRSKLLGEELVIFPTAEDATEWFRSWDKDYQRLLEEALARAK